MKRAYLKANYHAHTPRCKHAWGTEREYIEAAIRSGIKVFGFSDHVPYPFHDGFESHIRMDRNEVGDYVADIHRLKEKFRDAIDIYVGFETEYIPEQFPAQWKLFQEAGCDYMIMGQHFITSELEGPYTGVPTRDEDFLKAYVDRVIEGMETGCFLYLAHPDIINYQGEETIYHREMTRLCRRLKELDIPLEINLLGIHENKLYPAQRFWAIAGEVGNKVVFGIDAHWPELIGDSADYEAGLRLVEKYGLELVEELQIPEFA